MGIRLLDLTTANLQKESERSLAVIKDKINTALNKGGLSKPDRQKYNDLLLIIQAIGVNRIDAIDKKLKKHRKGHRN